VRLGPDGARELAMLRWGLIPPWAKDAKGSVGLINARGETVASKPSFRAAYAKRRCLAPADGFYEWRAVGKLKQPYRVTLDNGPGHAGAGATFAMAGLWESWRANTPEAIESFCIITTSANERLAEIHDRMPVILHAADYETWLCSNDEAERLSLLRPYPAERMKVFPVSRRVNSPQFDDAECIAPMTLAG
jgi:putative SOS response-associated peptidase YedK